MQQLLGTQASSKKDISDIEQLQDQAAVRFIAGIKGKDDGVEDVKTRLGLIPVHKKGETSG